MSKYAPHRLPGYVFHVMNRATLGQLLFTDTGEFLAFQALLAQALIERPIRLLAYTLMPNHFHFALWPERENQVSCFLQWLCATHARRLRRKRGTSGRGAVYQSRPKAVPVETETYFYRMIRYVERNAPRAGRWSAWASKSSKASRSPRLPMVRCRSVGSASALGPSSGPLAYRRRRSVVGSEPRRIVRVASP